MSSFETVTQIFVHFWLINKLVLSDKEDWQNKVHIYLKKLTK